MPGGASRGVLHAVRPWTECPRLVRGILTLLPRFARPRDKWSIQAKYQEFDAPGTESATTPNPKLSRDKAFAPTKKPFDVLAERLLVPSNRGGQIRTGDFLLPKQAR